MPLEPEAKSKLFFPSVAFYCGILSQQQKSNEHGWLVHISTSLMCFSGHNVHPSPLSLPTRLCVSSAHHRTTSQTADECFARLSSCAEGSSELVCGFLCCAKSCTSFVSLLLQPAGARSQDSLDYSRCFPSFSGVRGFVSHASSAWYRLPFQVRVQIPACVFHCFSTACWHLCPLCVCGSLQQAWWPRLLASFSEISVLLHWSAHLPWYQPSATAVWCCVHVCVFVKEQKMKKDYRLVFNWDS